MVNMTKNRKLKLRKRSSNSNTPPQAGAKTSTSPNLWRDDWKRLRPIDLVNISAVCFREGTKLGEITPDRTFSRIKWISTSICFVLSWRTESDDNMIADLLSQKRVDESITGNPNSWRRERSQSSSHVPWAMTRYSASAEERETTAFFLLFQEVRWLP